MEKAITVTYILEIWMFWRYSTHILGKLHMMNIQLRQLYQMVFCCEGLSRF